MRIVITAKTDNGKKAIKKMSESKSVGLAKMEVIGNDKIELSKFKGFSLIPRGFLNSPQIQHMVLGIVHRDIMPGYGAIKKDYTAVILV